jgi:hypothetical protein
MKPLTGKVALVAGAVRDAALPSSWARPARVYRFTDRDGSRPDYRRYMREVIEAGKPADATGHR